ncbi:MAG: LPS export ABC transporter periplasmic protein LptC [Bacteroidetes bacterium]|uniref:LPS export ABC transporter periplasmic protein LptC n=1 Tax=Phaeocystidibacter marisrubri TaxID=1577780 RepID=A0A6L3ZEL6_9FLAO|nr:LPS export ABC transporter periplasmic protein LptC [Phaeocystidibacter marisrubri]KAB2815812.1 LPS export ABC transporter periplasmic protein LptC [Phaeocystidibacter marisrubri]TNE28546.1 MAG: LPS export ABC transporter periplasmic protein LptC [Bacteroidota bacterium]
MNSTRTYHRMRGIALAVPLFLFITACVNDQKQVRETVSEYDGPLRVQKEVDYTYTDSGIVKLNFVAPLALDYSHLEEDAYLKFPDGVDVTFFSDSGTVETTLRANSAIQFIDEQRWEAEGDVQVHSVKGESLATEKLYWNMKTHRISSDQQVTITTPDSKIWGKGFEADENMNEYEIHEVFGTIFLNESDSTETTTEDL